VNRYRRRRKKTPIGNRTPSLWATEQTEPNANLEGVDAGIGAANSRVGDVKPPDIDAPDEHATDRVQAQCGVELEIETRVRCLWLVFGHPPRACVYEQCLV